MDEHSHNVTLYTRRSHSHANGRQLHGHDEYGNLVAVTNSANLYPRPDSDEHADAKPAAFTFEHPPRCPVP